MPSSQFNGQPKLAQDIMATRLVAVHPETDVGTAINLMLRHGISGMPVIDRHGNYLGVFSEKCCMQVLVQTTEAVGEPWERPPQAKDFMVTRLCALRPDQDAVDAIGTLLNHRVSGAPVTDGKGSFLGVFSEKTAMNLLLEAAYEQLPSAEVKRFMDTDQGRIISESTDLLTVARMFLETPYRRLEIVRNGKLLGQISRRDVLRSARIFETLIRYQAGADRNQEPGPESGVLLKAHESLPSNTVFGFMDARAETIGEEEDLLSIAQRFLQTPYRRFPVLRDGQIVGQVSRRDVLAAMYGLLKPIEERETTFLYLSAIRDRDEAPSLED
jgi:CBS domain-containing protein